MYIFTIFITKRFQSTLLQEERLLYRLKIVMNLMLSIHAPTRGATTFYASSTILIGLSIHAPTRGATPSAKHLPQYLFLSIHAPTRGATS